MKQVEGRSLKVGECFAGDVYKDIARIHWEERGKRNKIGAVVAISVDGERPHFFSLRGLPDENKGEIRFDHVSRTELHLKLGDVRSFSIRKTNLWQKLYWAVHATDPAARIAAWIAVWSGIIAILGLLLAAWPIVEKWWSPTKAHADAVQPSTR